MEIRQDRHRFPFELLIREKMKSTRFSAKVKTFWITLEFCSTSYMKFATLSPDSSSQNKNLHSSQFTSEFMGRMLSSRTGFPHSIIGSSSMLKISLRSKSMFSLQYTIQAEDEEHCKKINETSIKKRQMSCP